MINLEGRSIKRSSGSFAEDREAEKINGTPSYSSLSIEQQYIATHQVLSSIDLRYHARKGTQ